MTPSSFSSSFVLDREVEGWSQRAFLPWSGWSWQD